MTGYNINSIVKYNFLNKVPMAIIRKSNGMTNISGGVAYNIINRTGKVGTVVKGMNNVNIYNNTYYSNEVWYNSATAPGTYRGLIDIYTNTDADGSNAPSTGTKIKNNIFYTVNQIFNIYIYDAACLSGFESDYNVFFSESGIPIFNYLGQSKTFAQWQALGYDTHSIVVNPHFTNFIDFIPANRLDYGTDLGYEWQAGLSTSAVWNPGSSPETTNQNGTWQVGARIFSSQIEPVTNISVSGTGGSSSISTDKGSLQLSAVILPANATDKSVTWSVDNGTGQATISSLGLLTAVTNGNVTARATAKDGSGVTGSLIVTISNQVIPVSGIMVSGTGGASTISVNHGTLQLIASILPSNATNKAVTWTLVNGSGLASISALGNVTAIDNGTVTATATANDGSGVYGSLVLTISKQIIPVTGITLTGAGGTATISNDKGSLQLTELVMPSNATDKTVTWTIVNGTGQASINSFGLVTAIENGTVSARATANDGTLISGSLIITITNQVFKVTGITVSSYGGSSTITTDNGTLQLLAAVFPANASDNTIQWSIVSGSGIASVSTTGLVTALDNGTATVRASANDGSGVYGTFVITISNQVIPVTGINVTGANGLSSITIDDGSLQISAMVLPANATNKSVTWTIVNETGEASISTSGLITAINNGSVTVIATAVDGSGIAGNLTITISNQIIPLTGITLSGNGGSSTITTDNGSLQLLTAFLPLNATNKTVIWSVSNGTGQASVNSSGVVTAIDNGTVTAKATSTDGSGVFGIFVITISNQITPVTKITVSGSGGARIITSTGGTLQMIASVLPLNASDKSVVWAITPGTGTADISSDGIVTAGSNGTVTVTATANDGSSIFGNMIIIINSSLIPVTNITVTTSGDIYSINTDKGTLQLNADVLPVNATDNNIQWSIENNSGIGSINASGLFTANADGTARVRATANDGSGVYGDREISVSNQIVLVSGISVTGMNGANLITTDNGTLQLITTVLPENATNRNVSWLILNGTGEATISATGIVTAVANGVVTAVATATDGSGISSSIILTLTNQIVPVSGITISGAGGAATITTNEGTLQLVPAILPLNSTDKSITWSITNGTGRARINAGGLVTSVANGTVTATATANDGSGANGSLVITITNQIVLVSGITVTGAGGITSVDTDNGTLQLNAIVLPADATDKSVVWSIAYGTTMATINVAGLLKATANGTVTVRASAHDGSGVYGTIVITLTNQLTPVTGITVSGENGSTSISNDAGVLQLLATVLPSNATNQDITWSIENGTGHAEISSTGRVTALDNGTVMVRASANDGSAVSGTIILSISNQIKPVTAITLAGEGGISTISTDNGQLQILNTVMPTNATNSTVTWSVHDDTGQASIDATGLITAIDNGTVTVMATSNDGSGISGTIVITILNQIVPVADINIYGTGYASIITTNKGSLQILSFVTPDNAHNKSLTWSIENISGRATISQSGLLTAVSDGTVRITAAANDGSGVADHLVVTIYNQVVPVTAVSVTGSGGSSSIATNGGSLQLSALVTPSNASDKSIKWTITNGTGKANISSSGLVTALSNGTVTARATSNDGSGVYGLLLIAISNQTGPVTSITITGANGVSSISNDKGSLQLSATILPANATVKTVTWSFVDNSGIANINAMGMVTAVSNGTITARATANDGSGVFGTYLITITNQIIRMTSVVITGTGGLSSINVDNGTLQLGVSVLPLTTNDKTVVWSILSGTGEASINTAGLVTAISDGTVTVIATAHDGSGVYGSFGITITNQIVPVSQIVVKGENNYTSIDIYRGTLQLTSTVYPINASNKNVSWSLVDGAGKASISSTGLLSASGNGTVTVVATSTDGSNVSGNVDITLSGQIIQVTAISIKGFNGEVAITPLNKKLQLSATVLPANATDKSVTWSLASGSGLATINPAGLVTAIDNGTVIIKATANDGSGIYGLIEVPILTETTELTSIVTTRQEMRIQLNEKYISWKISLFNQQGRMLLSKLVESDLTVLDISKIPSGVYIVSVSKGELLKVAKTIKP